MKIWQRIFVVTMFVVTVFTLVMGLLLIGNQYKYQMEGAVKSSKQFHERVLSSVNVEVQKKMQEEKKAFLDDDEFMDAYETAYNKFSDLNYGIKLSADNENELYNYDFDSDISEKKELKTGDDAKYQIVHKSEYYFLIMSSNNSVYGRYISCVTEADITDIYHAYNAQIDRLKFLTVVLAVLSAVILLVIIKFMLNPIKKLQKGIHDIADGNYGKQLIIKGRTEISELTADVNQMSIKIEADNRAKEEMIEHRQIFIDNMAHEMKTPLTAILGFSDILTIKQNLTEEEIKKYSEYVYKEALRLKAMSGKLMELAQIGEENVKNEIVDVGEIVSEVIHGEQIILDKQNTRINKNLISAKIWADRDLMKSVFYNILDNAGKATAAGETIDVYMNNDKDSVVINVKDYGVGIPKEESEKVMEPFYMVDKSRSRKHGGAGLGLALCKKIVEISGGNIIIDSDTGKGCTVMVVLPLYQQK